MQEYTVLILDGCMLSYLLLTTSNDIDLIKKKKKKNKEEEEKGEEKEEKEKEEEEEEEEEAEVYTGSECPVKSNYTGSPQAKGILF